MAEGILDILRNLAGAQVSDEEKENRLAEELRQKRIVDLVKSLSGAQVSSKEEEKIDELMREQTPESFPLLKGMSPITQLRRFLFKKFGPSSKIIIGIFLLKLKFLSSK